MGGLSQPEWSPCRQFITRHIASKTVTDPEGVCRFQAAGPGNRVGDGAARPHPEVQLRCQRAELQGRRRVGPRQSAQVRYEPALRDHQLRIKPVSATSYILTKIPCYTYKFKEYIIQCSHGLFIIFPSYPYRHVLPIKCPKDKSHRSLYQILIFTI